MEQLPVSIERTGDASLEISWSDGTKRSYTAGELRAACPCATCREKGKAEEKESPGTLPVLSLAEAQPLAVRGMQPVGNYAYNIVFSDGHDSGIFTFDLLYSLGRS